MKGVVAAAALMLSLTTPPAIAQDAAGRGVHERRHAQQHDIEQGRQSDEPIRQEAHRPTREQRRLRAKERRYGADGGPTATERQNLRRDVNRANGGTYRQAHDDQPH